MRKFLIGFSLAVILTMFLSSIALAAENPFTTAKNTLQTGGTAAMGDSANANLPVVIGNIVRAIIVICSLVLTVYIVQAGYKYMQAGGDPAMTTKAKDMIKNGIIGLVIMLLAYSISSYVISWMVKAATEGQ